MEWAVVPGKKGGRYRTTTVEEMGGGYTGSESALRHVVSPGKLILKTSLKLGPETFIEEK